MQKSSKLHPIRRALAALENITLRLEAPLAHWVRDPRFNPLYHTGTLAIFLLLVLLVTGIYLTMFYQFGFQVSYEAVANIESSPLGRIVRALHRYASAALMLTVLLHAWRTFFQDRFRGARWLAWFSGVLLTFAVWVIGASGYWLIWDERVHLLNHSLTLLLQNLQAGQTFLVTQIFGKPAYTGWQFMVLLITLHFGLSLLLLFGLASLHFKRLARAKWLPPNHWMLGGLIVLTLVAIFFPAGMLPALDTAQWAANPTPIDLFYLAYLPLAIGNAPLAFWLISIMLLLILAALPQILQNGQPKPVALNLAACDGCTLCARDCPYNAIVMTERKDGLPHKFQAEIYPKLCVSCGICVGSCPEGALTLNGVAPHKVGAATLGEQRGLAGAALPKNAAPPSVILFTCQRHILHSAPQSLYQLAQTTAKDAAIIPLTCIGEAHPDLAIQALKNGAKSVHFIGCPAEDCANREGNLWFEQRITRERLPRLRSEYANAAIYTHYPPPMAVNTPTAPPSAYSLNNQPIAWKKFVPGLSLLLIVLLLQVIFTRWQYTPAPAARTWVQITLPHRSGYPVLGSRDSLPPQIGLQTPVRLLLQVDGGSVWQAEYPADPEGINAFAQIELPPGEHHLRLTLFDRPDPQAAQTLFEDTLTLAAGQILELDYQDEAIGGDPKGGRDLFYENAFGSNAGCRICHSLEPNQRLVGPSLYGVATRAQTRVPGMSAEDYLRQSILEPDAYVVEGYPAGQMIPNLGDILTDSQLEDLIAFLLTLEE